MKVFLKILIFSVFAINCQNTDNKDKNRLITFDLKQLPKVSSVMLSDLGFGDIEYIPLETNEQSMISGTNDLLMRNNLVSSERNFIMHRFTSILEFKNNGKFITGIGTKGRGPNEITAAHDVNFNRTNQNIYLLARWQKKFFVYSENGNLLKTFPITFSPSEFQFIDDKILCYSENHMGDIQNSYTLTDTNGRVIKHFPNKYPFKNHDAYGIEAENLFYRFENKLFKKEVYSDTIYSCENEKFTPHMVIQVGEKLISPQARTEFESRYLAINFIIPLNLFEFGDYVYYEFVYRFVVPNDVLIYSFIGSKKTNFKAMITTDQGFTNDLDGGPNILPKTIKDDSTIIGWVDALKLKAHVASEVFKKSTPKYPEKKKKLEKLANSLEDTDNPVLMLVSLKK